MSLCLCFLNEGQRLLYCPKNTENDLETLGNFHKKIIRKNKVKRFPLSKKVLLTK